MMDDLNLKESKSPLVEVTKGWEDAALSADDVPYEEKQILQQLDELGIGDNLKPTAPLDFLQLEGTEVDEIELVQAVTNFLAPLQASLCAEKPKINVEKREESSVAILQRQRALVLVLKALNQFIWDPSFIYGHKGTLRRVANQIRGFFNVDKGTGQSDVDDALDWKPSEVLATKATLAFIALVLPDVDGFKQELNALFHLIEDTRVATDARAVAGYNFVAYSLKYLYMLLMNDFDEMLFDTVPKFHELDSNSKLIVNGMSFGFIKNFKVMSVEKVERLQNIVEQDSSNTEWMLALGECLRLRRRGNARKVWPSQEEMSLLERVVNMEPQNPFVRLALLDTIIGNVRDSSGRFYCGDLRLDCMEDSMRYLYDNCLKLVSDYPKNVHLTSTISDYFARYFPHQYFDVDQAKNLLQSAYDLNPNLPKTTHRFGILLRMSFGEVKESLSWLKKTIELDPTHYSATLEYYKSLLGNLRHDEGTTVLEEMTATAESLDAEGWSDLECSDFLFFLGLGHFVKGDAEKALELWEQVAKVNETQFLLEDLLISTENFDWDQKLFNIDNIKLWFQAEKKKLTAIQKENGGDGDTNVEEGKKFDQRRKEFVDHIFSLMLGYTSPRKGKHVEKLLTAVPNMPKLEPKFHSYIIQ